MSLVPLAVALLLTPAPDEASCWTSAESRSIHREGVVRAGRLDGTFRVWTRRDGAYRLETQVGPTRRTVVYDGRHAFVQDGSSRSREIDGADLAQVLSDAALERGRLNPPGAETLTVATAACEPLELKRRQGDRTLTLRLSGWTTVDGLRLPGRRVESTGDEKYDTVYEYGTTKLDEPIDEALFTAPASRLKPEMTGAFVEVPIELSQNHVYLQVIVNGQAGSWFVLDSGAEVSVMDEGHATSLGLRSAGAVEARGVGEASIDAAMIPTPTLQIGALKAPLEAIYTIPLEPLWRRAGRAFHGILGYDVLGHFAVEIDYAHRVARFHDPEQLPKTRAFALPFHYDGNVPSIAAKVEVPGGQTFDARMTIDTGATGALTLSSPFVDAHHLRESAGQLLAGSTGMGIGGSAKQDVGRIAALHVGPFRLPAVITNFSKDTRGAAASPDVQGNIGGEVLRRFTVVIDYPHRVMLLTPNDALDEPFESDASGLQVEATAGFAGVVVSAVLPGTPAAEAGIAKGEELVSIDGVPVRGDEVPALRKRLREPGRTLVLELKQGGATRRVTVVTRRLV